MRRTCLDLIYQLALQDERIFFMGSDLGVNTLSKFRNEMPDRFFMEGISEANVLGMAAGLALEGKILYVNTIATFLTRRSLEQVVVDLCLHRARVRLIGNGGGLVYAPLGPTHMAIEDLALMRALPNMTIIAPADAEEMTRVMPMTVDHPGPIYIRLAKGYDPVVTAEGPPFSIGQARLMRSGRDALLITTGVTLQTALEAAEGLSGMGVEAAILHLPTVKPIDDEAIRHYASMAPVVVTVEEHTLIGGLGSAVLEVLAEADALGTIRFRRLGLPDAFPDGYGSQADLMERYGLTAKNIMEIILDLKAPSPHPGPPTETRPWDVC